MVLKMKLSLTKENNVKIMAMGIEDDLLLEEFVSALKNNNRKEITSECVVEPLNDKE